MDWGKPESFTGGNGVTQKSANPGGYAVTYTRNENGTASYCASRGNDIFARFYLENTEDRALMQAAARSMRVACGMHADASSPKISRASSRDGS